MDFAAIMRDEKAKLRRGRLARSSQSIMEKKKSLHLENHLVGSLPKTYYIPDWITKAEETALVAAIAAEEKWVQLTKRRLQNWVSFFVVVLCS